MPPVFAELAGATRGAGRFALGWVVSKFWKTCGVCQWYREAKGADSGQCMRMPPVLLHGRVSVTQMRPAVDADEWCGEWREREDD